MTVVTTVRTVCYCLWLCCESLGDLLSTDSHGYDIILFIDCDDMSLYLHFRLLICVKDTSGL